MIREPKPLKPTALAVLDAVRRYHQLTTDHMMTLGLSRNVASLRRVIREELTNRKRPLLHRVSYAEDGETVGRKRRHDLFSLTQAGAQWLERLNEEEAGSIPCFTLASKIEQDYLHRTLTIHAIITLEALARSKGYEVETYPYYAPLAALPSSSPSYPRERDGPIEPDAIMLLRKDGKPSHLFALEFHHKQNPASVYRQILGICELIASGVVSMRLGVSLPLRLISFSHKNDILDTVIAKLSKSTELSELSDYILLTVPDMALRGRCLTFSLQERDIIV